MAALPGSETVPYHVAWATFALCFGRAPWSPLATWLTMTWFTVATGSILVYRVADGVLEWQETCEIPLMLTLLLLMVWHVRRRQSDLAAVTVLALPGAGRSPLAGGADAAHLARDALAPDDRRGYLEALTSRPLEPEVSADLRIVEQELTRLTRVCDRLVRSMQVNADLEMHDVDVDALVRSTAERWSAVADRDWRVDAWGGTMWGSAERTRACLDTLVENAVRYTGAGDTVQPYLRLVDDETLAVGVADSGPGFAPELIAGGDGTASGTDPGQIGLVRDELSQTGLGISLVREVAARRGGRVRLRVSPWGGADVAMILPRQPRQPRHLAAPQTVPAVLDADPPLEHRRASWLGTRGRPRALSGP